MSVNVAQLQLGQLVNCGVDATHLLPNGGGGGWGRCNKRRQVSCGLRQVANCHAAINLLALSVVSFTLD